MRIQLLCRDCSFSPDFNVSDRERANEVLAHHRFEFHASAYSVDIA